MLAAVHDRPSAGLACADVGDGQTPVVDNYFGGMTMPARVRGGLGAGRYPHGTLMLARRACLEQIGLFDERYFAYCEEADLGERAAEPVGRSGSCAAPVSPTPISVGGSAIVDYLMLRNTLLLVRKHFGRYRATSGSSSPSCISCGDRAPSSRPWIFAPAARVRALVDYTRGRFGPPPQLATPGRAPSTRGSRTPVATRSSRRH